MKKVINFVDKKELIIVTVLTFLIALTGLFATYAIDTSLSYNDTTEYDMSLSFDLSASTNKQVTIQAGKTKFFDIDVKNSNSGTIKYGIAYSMVTPSSLPEGVTIAKSWKSANPPSGLINANATLPVTIAVENTSSTDITISLSIINGYEKGGDLILPTGKVLIEGEYNPVGEEEITRYYLKSTSVDILNTIGSGDCMSLDGVDLAVGDNLYCMQDQGDNFLDTPVKNALIANFNIIKNSEIPDGVTGPIDVSRDQDGTVNFYYKNSSTTSTLAPDISLYDVYIATENGKVFLTSGESLFATFLSLQSLDLSNVYTDEVTSMRGMFAGCIYLSDLNLSNFDTSNVTDMSLMFSGPLSVNAYLSYLFPASTITSLDLSSFNTENVTNMEGMFRYMEKLKTIYVGKNFSITKVSNSNKMFDINSSLVGGNGTVYNSSYIDKTYARIDTSSTPGYFTLKS